MVFSDSSFLRDDSSGKGTTSSQATSTEGSRSSYRSQLVSRNNPTRMLSKRRDTADRTIPSTYPEAASDEEDQTDEDTASDKDKAKFFRPVESVQDIEMVLDDLVKQCINKLDDHDLYRTYVLFQTCSQSLEKKSGRPVRPFRDPSNDIMRPTQLFALSNISCSSEIQQASSGATQRSANMQQRNSCTQQASPSE